MRDFALTIQLWAWLSFSLVGCAWLGFTPDSSLNARKCATHTALGCAAKAALHCTVRGPMDGFVGCVVEKSGACATQGVFGCIHSALYDGGDRSHDGRWDAVEMVAQCYVDVCMGGE